MRFWQKTYIFTLILFLLCINAGVLSLTVYTHQKNVEAAETTASAEQYYIAMAFERDYNDITLSGEYESPLLLMESFGAHYKSRGIYLSFSDEDRSLYSSFPFEYTASANSLHHTKVDGERHIVISGVICDGRYTLDYSKSVASLDREFRSLMVSYTLTSLGVSAFLAVCLFFILKKLSAPLEKLRKTTELIEGGDFSVRADESGTDEFTLLSRSFNSMLQTINEQMATLEHDAQKKQMLVDNMAHELRTPLTSIHGYAEYLEKASTSEQSRITAAKYIMSESKRLQRISEVLLDSAYIRENTPEFCDVDLASLLCDIAQRLRIRASEHRVVIRCDTEQCTVKGNATLLSMLFYNLCENAIKACADGGEVRIGCTNGVAFVRDNGKGMTQEQLVHITEPFYRTDKSRSRAEGGAGLGLSLCRQIVASHGAELCFDSEIGAGTEVRVTFTT